MTDPAERALGRPDGRRTGPTWREAALGRKGVRGPLLAALLTTLLATLLSYTLPDAHAATGVGLSFLAVTYLLVLRDADTETIRDSGLSLGGLFEAEPLSARGLGRAALGALGWASAAAALIFPVFWLGFWLWHAPGSGFTPAPLGGVVSDASGQLLGVAFPEEVFFRGYLQSALDRVWPPRWRLLGARLGPAVVVASLLFAVGHLLTDPHPARLAVFFPSLAFGFLRARTGGVGAPIAFHAACNLFASYLGRSYGLHS